MSFVRWSLVPNRFAGAAVECFLSFNFELQRQFQLAQISYHSIAEQSFSVYRLFCGYISYMPPPASHSLPFVSPSFACYRSFRFRFHTLISSNCVPLSKYFTLTTMTVRFFAVRFSGQNSSQIRRRDPGEMSTIESDLLANTLVTH